MGDVEYKARLESQLKEAYVKVLYTYQTQQEAASLKIAVQRRVSMIQIILTSLISVGFVGAFFSQTGVTACLSAVLAAVSLCLNIYTRSARNEERANSHTRTADQLWVIVQDYISLLTDFDDIGLDEIKAARQDLQSRTAEVYSRAPRTNKRAYELARKALKKEEAQSFGEGECEKLLPVALRKVQ
ncbi:SLATT domain-containing protein [Adlercreutzia sp. ZJ138]|uniref:SLATT domain-containing protein n=1 Tax=Adlercreutzia sp. ZJ138 TaxID=2709405 RepID=UPI0013EA62FD|nr:SLATT domain-containing protein [Adlercreutzia sp. ZJ138]